eukprot:s165_g27.t1
MWVPSQIHQPVISANLWQWNLICRMTSAVAFALSELRQGNQMRTPWKKLNN